MTALTTPVITRFAPSPTGRLHIGNARAAVLTWLLARKSNGQLILRNDDTDTERSTAEYAQGIKNDMAWLGLNYDRYESQISRLDVYKTALDKLKASGRLYPCYETAEELGLKRKAQLGSGKPPRYDRTALNLSDEQKAQYKAEGRKPHWRFKLEHKEITWNDLIRGKISFQGSDLSDPVLVRADDSPLYHICSVIDDVDYGVTHIVRGEDHVANTAAHIQMFEALGAPVPQFAHLSMILNEDGTKFSKRIGSLAIQELDSIHGLDPLAIISFFTHLGSSLPTESYHSVEDAIAAFDISAFNRNNPRFVMDELKRINGKILHERSFAQVKDGLSALGLTEVNEAFWNAVRGNITVLKDVKDWWDIANSDVTPVIEDAAFTKTAAELLPTAPWNNETWSHWTKAIKDATDRKGKQLFMPLRLALTGQSHGPELGVILQLIGYERAKARLTTI